MAYHGTRPWPALLVEIGRPCHLMGIIAGREWYYYLHHTWFSCFLYRVAHHSLFLLLIILCFATYFFWLFYVFIQYNVPLVCVHKVCGLIFCVPYYNDTFLLLSLSCLVVHMFPPYMLQLPCLCAPHVLSLSVYIHCRGGGIGSLLSF